MKHFVGVGACYLDTILCVPRYPAEDEKLRATSLSTRRGGNCPNTLEVLQGLLQSVETPPTLNLISVLPSRQCSATKRIQESLGPGVSLRACLHREEHGNPPSSYIIRSAATGSRTIVNANDLPEMTCDEFREVTRFISQDDTWYHFEGRIPDVIFQCIKYLRASCPGVRISVELEKPGRDGLQELASEADVVFYSKSWAIGNGYRSAEECLEAQAKLAPEAQFLFCTWGDRGSFACEPRTKAFYSAAATIPEGLEVIDTVGAGDTFIAGIIYGFIGEREGWPVEQKLRFANQLAGLKIVQEGFAGLHDFT